MIDRVRLLICGSRHFTCRTLAFTAIDSMVKDIGKPAAVISGMAKGADTLGVEWAVENGVPVVSFPANWKKHHKAAGPIRNQQMIDEGCPTHAIAFLFSGSRGTADMVRRLKKAGIPYVVPRLE